MSSMEPANPVLTYFAPGIFFVTCETINRERILDSGPKFHLVRTVLNGIKRAYPYAMLGYVFLPDHLHLLLKPADGVTLDRLMKAFMPLFSQDYWTLLGMPRGGSVWQTSYRMDKVVDEGDFATRLDYLHYNPVQHKLVARPEEWPQSSYETWVERGIYDLGWGWTEPESIRGKRWR